MLLQELVILGSGTILPLKGRGGAGYLVRGDSGCLLLDCGPGTLSRLGELSVSPAEINDLMITHFHLDHVSDLAALLNARWLALLPEKPSMNVLGPIGMRGYIDWLGQRMDRWFGDFRISVRETGSGNVPMSGMTVRAEKTGHTPESVCYRLTDETGTTFFFTGDTDYNEALVPIAADADVAIFECAMPDEKKLAGHLTPTLAGRLAQKASVKRLVLTHFYPEVLAVDIRSAVSREYSGEIILAEDGMRLLFSHPRE